MSDTPNRILSPKELEQFKKEKELEKILLRLEDEYAKRSEVPSKWAGYLIAILAVAIFIDISGWMVAFLSGSFYSAMAFLLQTTETICIVWLALFAIQGTIQAYKLQEEKKAKSGEFWNDQKSC